MNNLLHVDRLAVDIESKVVIDNVSLSIEPGVVHAIMGPNGSGKSSLAHTIIGHPDYRVKHGTIEFEGKGIIGMPVDQRTRAGIFLSFQHPVAIPGVQVLNFLHEAYAAMTSQSVPLKEFTEQVKSKMDLLSMDESFLFRNLNEGFSGGEKKLMELLQCLVLQPKLAIFDEIDSGLDVDALHAVARGINMMRKERREFSVLIITHYARILKLVEPDVVHVMHDGKIIETGCETLAYMIDGKGYDAFI